MWQQPQSKAGYASLPLTHDAIVRGAPGVWRAQIAALLSWQEREARGSCERSFAGWFEDGKSKKGVTRQKGKRRVRGSEA
eukprot:281244-Rhodomonas_salina.2